MIEFLSVVCLLVVLILCGLKVAKENETGVIMRLGKPVRIAKSGLTYILWPLEYMRLFTTSLVELNFEEAHVITKKGKFDGENYNAARLTIKTTMYFRWPDDNKLLQTIKIISDPQDVVAVKSLFEEATLDAFRSVGGSKTWREIVQDRKGYAQEVLDIIKTGSEPMKQACIPDTTVKLVVNKLELPEALTEAITAPEVAKLKADAMKAEAEGTREKRKLEGEGDAQARKFLFEAIKEQGDQGLQYETLLTLREMAKGTSNTILFPIPSELTDLFGNAFGGAGKDHAEKILRRIISGLKPEDFDEIIKDIMGGKK